ncbi:MAG: cation:dicarboxylase symporter family transporter [Spirochaetales bacterium]|nr:cation:dicarboxylase symporter family transporter [Spirochaetales bacterium]
MKYTISAVLGVGLALLLPDSSLIDSIFRTIAEITLRAGRFIAFPLVFFTLSVSVCQLRRSRDLLKISLKLLALSAGAVLLYTVVAVGLSFILPVQRIPILTDSTGWQSAIPFRNSVFNPGAAESLRALLPVNSFEIFQNPGDFILPALLFAFILGTQLYRDREEAEPVFNLFDSFSRMFYMMTGLFTTLLVFTVFSLSYDAVRLINEIPDMSSYFSLIRLVGAASLLLLFVLQPLALYLLTKRNPYKEMMTFLPGLITALFSGDSFINMLVLIKTLKENGGVKRKLSGLSIPFFTLFSRSGSAMITAISMLTILKSYSSLELTAFQIFWIIGISILVSYTLFAQSYLGIYTALITACSLYGRGLTDGYVLILPLLPVLTLTAGLLDTANTAFLTLCFGEDKDLRIPEEQEDFI